MAGEYPNTPELKDEFAELPIMLNDDLELTQVDVERRLEMSELSTATIGLKYKDNFPPYSLNPDTRHLVVVLKKSHDEVEYKPYLLKPESTLLAKYLAKYQQT